MTHQELTAEQILELSQSSGADDVCNCSLSNSHTDDAGDIYCNNCGAFIATDCIHDC